MRPLGDPFLETGGRHRLRVEPALDLERSAALEEAALLDGLSRLQIIWRIVVPVIMPGIASTAIFTFVFTWNEYLMALMLTAFNAVTVPVTIAKFVMPYTILWGAMSAAVVIQVVPMLIVVFLLQQHIVRGMTLGAVK